MVPIPPTVPGTARSPWLKNFAFAAKLNVQALPAEDASIRTDEDGLPASPCLRCVGFYGSEFRSSEPGHWPFLFRAATGFSLEKVTVVERGVIRDYAPPPWLDDLLGNKYGEAR